MTIAPPDQALRAAVSFAAAEFASRRRPRRTAIDESAAWHELVACIIGGATRFEHAVAAAETIRSLIPTPWAMRPTEFRRLRADVDSGALRLPTRFPKEHARYLLSAVDTLYLHGSGISPLLSGLPATEMRRELVGRIPGVGPKQASLFLLNLGVTDDLAVLDRHVLRYMVWICAIDDDRPPRSIREYEATEARFRAHARVLGHSMVDVDRAVWLTARVWGELMQ